MIKVRYRWCCLCTGKSSRCLLETSYKKKWLRTTLLRERWTLQREVSSKQAFDPPFLCWSQQFQQVPTWKESRQYRNGKDGWQHRWSEWIYCVCVLSPKGPCVMVDGFSILPIVEYHHWVSSSATGGCNSPRVIIVMPCWTILHVQDWSRDIQWWEWANEEDGGFHPTFCIMCAQCCRASSHEWNP